jgi:hypothetical protein
MNRYAALIITALCLLIAPHARAEGYAQGTKEQMQFVAEWDAFLRGLPMPGIPQCPSRLPPQYQGCMGPWGPNGSWYGWTYSWWPVTLVSGGTWQTFLDDGVPGRIELLAESSPEIDWDMFAWLALNRVCTPGPYQFKCPFTRVNFYTYTQEEVVEILTAAWESTL